MVLRSSACTVLIFRPITGVGFWDAFLCVVGLCIGTGTGMLVDTVIYSINEAAGNEPSSSLRVRSNIRLLNPNLYM